MLRTLSIQLLILVIMLAVVEVAARFAEPYLKKPLFELNMALKPYIMFGANSYRNPTWLDNLQNNKEVPSKMAFNNYGYSEDFDYTMVPEKAYLEKYGKKPGERIVLITGGSVVHGVGATANDKTIAGQMQRYLREKDPATRWRVINMGMGSWIAYQQFIGLSLFGLPFEPDWVVAMDGHNDAAVPCAHGAGVGNPLGWPRVLYMSQGGLKSGAPSPFLVNLAQLSATVRLLNGVDPAEKHDIPIPNDLEYDAKDPDPRFAIKLADLRFQEQEKQLDFYLQAERNVIALFSKANILMSTQPVMWDNALGTTYRKAFAPGATEKDLAELDALSDDFMAKNVTEKCTSEKSSVLLGYFLGKSGLELKAMMEKAQAADPSRKLLYENVEWSMPVEPEVRKPYFIDNAHMSDKGQERVGEFFADIILSAEKGRKFDYAEFVRRHEQ